MKQFILFAICFWSVNTIGICAQDSLNITEKATIHENLNTEAIKAYEDGNYRKAIELFVKEIESLKNQGEESASLYYNLGNAHFRANEVAQAILYYERALLIDPGDRDIRHNIEYANTKIEDKILVADQFILSSWLISIENLMSSNAWAMFAIICFVVLIGCLAVFFFSGQIRWKKITFYTGIVLIVFIIIGNVFSYRQKQEIEQRDTAIVMAASAPVHSSPDSNSKELFILHSGTKVVITKEDKIWLEIEINDGNVGWIRRNMIEII